MPPSGTCRGGPQPRPPSVSQDGVFTQDAASGRKTGRVAKRLTERGPSWVGRVVVILASHCPLEHTGTLT
jgi:hypothetical protein